MEETNTQQNNRPKIVIKHTSKEFWDSITWSLENCDDEVDGNLHLVSSFDGSGTKIPLKDILGEEVWEKILTWIKNK